MRVLGIDPGLTRCGWGVVEGRPGAKPTALGVGVIRSSARSRVRSVTGAGIRSAVTSPAGVSAIEADDDESPTTAATRPSAVARASSRPSRRRFPRRATRAR